VSGPIIVAGPGPIEPGSSSGPSSLPIGISKPAPPLPPDLGLEGGLLEREGSAGEEEDDEDEDAGFAKSKLVPVRQMTTTDPYANLNAAFGEYAVDVPQPRAAGQDAGLLF
jgi:AP-2 complex subunit beta-1